MTVEDWIKAEKTIQKLEEDVRELQHIIYGDGTNGLKPVVEKLISTLNWMTVTMPFSVAFSVFVMEIGVNYFLFSR